MTRADWRYELIDTDAGFDALDTPWTELLNDSEADPLFCSFPWMRTWWRHYGHLGGLRIAVLREGGRILGIAPLYVRKMTARELEIEMVGKRRFLVGTEGPHLRVLQPLGNGEVCSDFLGFIARRGRADEVWSGLYTHLHNKVRRFDLLFMTDVDEETPGFDGLQYAGMAGRHTRYRDNYNAPYSALPGGYDEYLGTLSRKSRYNARKKLKQISIFHQVEHRFHQDPDTLDQAMDALFALHTRRWKDAGEKGVFCTQAMNAFHKAMAREGLRLGWLRLGSLHLDRGPAVFYTYAYHAGNRVYLYQQGGSTEHTRFNLGYAALSFALRDACQRGAKSYEFLRGEAKYKGHWAKSSRRLVQLLVGRSMKSSQFFARSFINTDPKIRQSIKRIIRRGAS